MRRLLWFVGLIGILAPIAVPLLAQNVETITLLRAFVIGPGPMGVKKATNLELAADYLNRFLEASGAQVRVKCEVGFSELKFEPFAESAPYICHVHVHDNFGLGEVATIEPYIEGLPLGEGDLHLPLGWGCIPYRDVFATMKRWYRGAYVLELKPRFFEVGLASTALQDLRNLVQGA